MAEERILHLEKKTYVPAKEKFKDSPYKIMDCSVEFDFSDLRLHLETTNRKQEQGKWITTIDAILDLKFNSLEQFVDFAEFIENQEPRDSGESRVFKLRNVDGHVADRINEERRTTNVVHVYSNSDRFVFENFQTGNTVLPYATEENLNEIQDSDNLHRLKGFLTDICDNLSNNIEFPLKVDGWIREYMEKSQYGESFLAHAEDAKKCLEKNLFHPAMGSLIHAYEWAMVVYLDEECDMDVVAMEKRDDDLYFTLAGRDPSLLEKVLDHAEVDQKTVAKIKEMNNAERRWVAHHKSGEIFEVEVVSAAERLNTLLDSLFKK